jgi:hypothetical protein
MAAEDLDALLERMPSIAEAINAFTSEAVQAEAFAALIAAFEGRRHGAPKKPAQEPAEEPGGGSADLDEAGAGNGENTSKGASAQRRRKAGGNGRVDWAMVHTLNLMPDGKQSFDEFIEEKQPKSNEDKYAVAVYYLQEIMGLSPVTKNEIGTLFRLTKSWKEPAKVLTGLRTTSSRKSTVLATNPEDISITPQGRNFVEHELPVKPKAKK